MFEICVFAGTTEGRRLVELMRGQAARVLACVATEYGEALIPRGENVEVAAGRLDEAGMEVLFGEHRFALVIDATHPFAAEASGNIAAACAATGTEYLRLNRAETDPDGDAVYVDSIQAAADFLAAHPGNALITTGGKALAPYRAVPDYRERLWVRVLPMEASLTACAEAGFKPAHIIAMQGPFSSELNAAMLRAIRADWLVTKDSGDSGGLREKLEAARAAGARCVVVGRPEQAPGLDFSRTVALLTERFGLEDVRHIDVIGIGMGGADALTWEASRAVEASDCVIGASRMLEAVRAYGKPAYAEIAPERIVAAIAAHPEHRRVAVLMSGDPGFFSGAKRLLPLLAGHRVRVLPGISSLQALCARLGASWEDVEAISLHGRGGSLVPALRRRGRVFALLGDADGLKNVCADLLAAGMGNTKISLGQRLSYPDEAILTGTAEALRDTACDPLSALLIEWKGAPAPLPVGMPDGAFLRETGEKGKTVPMTKGEVRAVSISKLRLTESAVVWDVGAGTGSVSVEAALLCPRGQVWAVERREDAAALIERNAAKFGVKNLRVVRGEAPAALEGLPAPSHVFIGGSGGAMGKIVEAALERNPEARVVINAVTPESVGEIAAVIRDFGFGEHELIQLTVARARPVGKAHLMEGLNPVWIAAMQRHEGGDGE